MFHGISPDPKKIQAIQQMEFLPDKESMHSFLEMVNFLNRYFPRLVELSTSLKQLCQQSHFPYRMQQSEP